MSLEPTEPQRPLVWPAIIHTLQELNGENPEVYIVGGAVRDAYLHRPAHDIDLATPGDGRPLARKIANHLNGSYYSLDAERGVGRAIVPWENFQLSIDVAQFRGPDLLVDLQKRDFTVNAMAVQLASDLSAIIDPLGGLVDLQKKRLRQCDSTAMTDDPVRALRAIRASITFSLTIEADTQHAIRRAASQLAHTSIERIRDEFFHILNLPRPAAALTALTHLGLLEYIIPEIHAMQHVEQGAPHQFDVWQHTLYVTNYLDFILKLIAPQHNDNLTANIYGGAIAVALRPFRERLQAHLDHPWPNGRTHRALLMLAALLHDAGKPKTRTQDDSGKIRFLQHEKVGETLAAERAAALRLSRDEIQRLSIIVGQHMRPHWLTNASPPSARAVYRFWRDTGDAGIDICLLAMADYLGTYGVTLNTQDWTQYVEMTQLLINTYYSHPPLAPLITGQTLITHFGMEPGPQIGEIIEHIQEAQAVGDITTQTEALEWVLRFLNNHR